MQKHNDPYPSLIVDIVLGFPFRASPQSFKTRLLGEVSTPLIKGDLFSSPTNVGYHNPPLSWPRSLLALIPFFNRYETTTKSTSFGASVLTGTPPCVYPPWGIARRLTHCPVTGSDIICNDLDPPLADIVLFGLWRSVIRNMVSEACPKLSYIDQFHKC